MRWTIVPAGLPISKTDRLSVRFLCDDAFSRCRISSDVRPDLPQAVAFTQYDESRRFGSVDQNIFQRDTRRTIVRSHILEYEIVFKRGRRGPRCGPRCNMRRSSAWLSPPKHRVTMASKGNDQILPSCTFFVKMKARLGQIVGQSGL